jgi:putative nucleotidyltransferase with HDIG domain
MDKRLKKLYKIVENSFEERDYRYHILPVVGYAKKLARIYKAKKDVVEIAALLHDIGRINLKDDEQHHIVGGPVSEKILKDLGYSREIIEEVKHAVISHRAKKGISPKTMTAKIVANADAMSHFDMLPVFYVWLGGEKKKITEITEWIERKLERDWNKKLTLPEAREVVREKYKAIKILFAAIKKHQDQINAKIT